MRVNDEMSNLGNETETDECRRVVGRVHCTHTHSSVHMYASVGPSATPRKKRRAVSVTQSPSKSACAVGCALVLDVVQDQTSLKRPFGIERATSCKQQRRIAVGHWQRHRECHPRMPRKCMRCNTDAWRTLRKCSGCGANISMRLFALCVFQRCTTRGASGLHGSFVRFRAS